MAGQIRMRQRIPRELVGGVVIDADPHVFGEVSRTYQLDGHVGDAPASAVERQPDPGQSFAAEPAAAAGRPAQPDAALDRSPMNHFEARAGELHCEDVPLRRIAEEVGTPAYVYSTATLERHYQVFRDAFAPRPVEVAYAVCRERGSPDMPAQLPLIVELLHAGSLIIDDIETGAGTVVEQELVRRLFRGRVIAFDIDRGASARHLSHFCSSLIQSDNLAKSKTTFAVWDPTRRWSSIRQACAI